GRHERLGEHDEAGPVGRSLGDQVTRLLDGGLAVEEDGGGLDGRGDDGFHSPPLWRVARPSAATVPAGMRFRLVPTDDRFFDLFAQSAANVAEAARRLRDRVTAPTDADARHDRVRECERTGDELTHEILTRLNSTFVTP